MNNIRSPLEGNQEDYQETCPYLGLVDDRETSLAYPSSYNLCYHARPASPPSLDHQISYCQSAHHRDCPVFTNRVNGPLPSEIRFPETKPLFANRLILPLLLGSIVVIMGVIGMFWLAHGGILSGERKSPTPSSTLQQLSLLLATDIPFYTNTPTDTNTPVIFTKTPITPTFVTSTPTMTLVPTATMTPSPTHKIIITYYTDTFTLTFVSPPIKKPTAVPTHVP